MQPDQVESLDQIVLNRAPVIAEDEPERGKDLLNSSLTAGQPCEDQRDLSDGKGRNGRKANGVRDHLRTLPLQKAGRSFPRRMLSEAQVMVATDVSHHPVYPDQTLKMTL
jgi:hypothetical protein